MARVQFWKLIFVKFFENHLEDWLLDELNFKDEKLYLNEVNPPIWKYHINEAKAPIFRPLPQYYIEDRFRTLHMHDKNYKL